MRFWKDIPGQEQRALVRERICPISGPGRLSKAKLKEMAKEILEASGADSVEYFKEVVKEDRGVTFRESCFKRRKVHHFVLKLGGTLAHAEAQEIGLG